MKSNNYLAYLNIAGALSSILALILTLAQNETVTNIIEYCVSVVFFVAVMGFLISLAKKLKMYLSKFFSFDYWSINLLYKCVAGVIILFASFIGGVLGYLFSSWFFYMFNSFVESVKGGLI